VLTYIADLAAEGVLAPTPYTAQRYELTKWLNFISTELHKAIYGPLLNATANDGARQLALALVARRFDLLSRHLNGRRYLLDTFSVADAYLFAVLNWSEFAGVPIADWPVLKAWRDGLRNRPSVARSIAAEAPLRQAA
jgi:glutathione S-transferase